MRLHFGEFKLEEGERFWYETPRVVRPMKPSLSIYVLKPYHPIAIPQKKTN